MTTISVVTPGNLGADFDMGVSTPNKINVKAGSQAAAGKVRLATDAEVAAGTAGVVPDAAQLKAAVGDPLPAGGSAGNVLVKQADGSAKWASDADLNMFGPHAYWRIQMNAGATAATQIFELQFREVAGVSQSSTGGTTIQSSRLSPGYDASYAFDGNNGTQWCPFSAGVQYLGYQHPAARNVVEVAVLFSRAVGGGPGAPTDFQIDYSDDGSTWTTALHVTGLTDADWIDGAWKLFSMTQVSGARISVKNARDVNFQFVAGNDGKIPKYDHASGKLIPAAMPAGVPSVGASPDDDILTIVGGVPAWASPPSGSLPAVGTNGDVLTVVAGSPTWAAPTGGGGGGSDPAVAIPSAPGAGYVRLYALAPLIPHMTSASAPSGTVTSSGNETGCDGYYAFSGSTLNGSGNGWVTPPSGMPVWLAYKFPSAVAVNAYKLMPWSADTWNGRVQTAWTFQGYNTGTSSWDTLDTRTMNANLWQRAAAKTFILPGGPATYAKFRVNITAQNGDSRTGIQRLQLYGVGTPVSGEDMALFIIDENGRMTPIKIED